MNKIILSGNIVEDVNFMKTSNGSYFLKNKIAVQDNAKTEYEDTYFIPFRTFSKDVLKTFKTLKKGSLIEIEGKLVHKNYNKNGNWNTYCEVIVFKVNEIKFKKKENKEFFELDDDDIPF